MLGAQASAKPLSARKSIAGAEKAAAAGGASAGDKAGGAAKKSAAGDSGQAYFVKLL